jgi:predicted PurR-regulated permease PerM
VPRAIGAALMMGIVLTSLAGVTLMLREDIAKVVADLPDGARRLSAAIRPNGQPSTLDSLRKATTAIDKTAAEAAGVTTAPRGVMRVQVEGPAFRASDFLWSGSMGLALLAGQLVMVSFLAYFLLLADDLFKRKLVKHASSTLAGKKITVSALEAIGSQIEQFMLVQIFTSVLVGVATALALWWLGLQSAAVWGLAAGVFNSIPYFGPFIVTAGLAVVAFLQFGTFGATALISGVALLITSLEGWVLTPALMGRTAQMNRVAVFAGLLFWSWMWGIWGTLLAVPMMMVVKVICDHVDDFQPVADFLSE